MRRPAHVRQMGHTDGGAAREVERRPREQDAPVAGERHHARRNRLRQPFHLERLGTARHVRRRVLAQHHLADVDAHAGTDRRVRCLAELAQPRLVVERKSQRLDRPLEQQQKAVALVDLAAVLFAQQVARDAVVPRQQIRRRRVTNALDELRARDQVAQQQGADRGLGRAGCGGHGKRCNLRTPRRRHSARPLPVAQGFGCTPTDPLIGRLHAELR